jgi:hypothetical protein
LALAKQEIEMIYCENDEREDLKSVRESIRWKAREKLRKV